MFGEAETPKEPSAVIRYTADIMTLPRPGGLQERGCPLGLGELFANNISTGEHCGQGLEEKSKQQEQVPPHLDDTKSSKEQPKSACISCRTMSTVYSACLLLI